MRRAVDVVAGTLVGEEGGGDRTDQVAVEERAELPVICHLADHGARQLPPLADGAHLLDLLRYDDGNHSLLRLGDHDLPRLEAVLAQRHAVEVDVDADLPRHLRERRGEPRGAAVLQAEDEPALDELERDLDQRLAAERVADLHRWPLRVRAFEVLAREDRRAADPIAPGKRAVENNRIADARRLRLEHALGRE